MNRYPPLHQKNQPSSMASARLASWLVVSMCGIASGCNTPMEALRRRAAGSYVPYYAPGALDVRAKDVVELGKKVRDVIRSDPEYADWRIIEYGVCIYRTPAGEEVASKPVTLPQLMPNAKIRDPHICRIPDPPPGTKLIATLHSHTENGLPYPSPIDLANGRGEMSRPDVRHFLILPDGELIEYKVGQ